MVYTIQKIDVDFHRQNYITLYAHQYDSGQQLDISVYDNGDLVYLGEGTTAHPGVNLETVRVKIETPGKKHLMLTDQMPIYQEVNESNIYTYFPTETEWNTKAYYTDNNMEYVLAVDKGYAYGNPGYMPKATMDVIDAGKIYFEDEGHYVTVDKELNIIHVDFPQSVFMDYGKVECEVVLLSKKILGTMHFVFLTEKSVYNEDDAIAEPTAQSIVEAILSYTKEYSQLTVRMANEAEESKDEAHEWADKSRDYAYESEDWSDKSSEYADNAKTSEENAKDSEDAAKESEDNAKLSEDNAKDSADDAKDSADTAKEHEDNAKDYALKSQSYATGDAKKDDGTDYRTGQSKDNAHYYAEKAMEAASRAYGIVFGAYKTWAEFQDVMTDPDTEDYVMYCIIEEFTTTSDFLIGEDIDYKSYTMVFRLLSGKWVAMASPSAGGDGVTVSPTEPEKQKENELWLQEY